MRIEATNTMCQATKLGSQPANTRAEVPKAWDASHDVNLCNKNDHDFISKYGNVHTLTTNFCVN